MVGVFLLAPGVLLQGMPSYFSGFILCYAEQLMLLALNSPFWHLTTLPIPDSLYLWDRGENGELRVGVRRALRHQTTIPSSVISSHSMHLGVLATAWHAVNTGSMFTVYYKPRFVRNYKLSNIIFVCVFTFSSSAIPIRYLIDAWSCMIPLYMIKECLGSTDNELHVWAELFTLILQD